MLPETNILLTNVFYNTYNYDIYNHECNKKRCKGVINEIQKVYIITNLERIRENLEDLRIFNVDINKIINKINQLVL